MHGFIVTVCHESRIMNNSITDLKMNNSITDLKLNYRSKIKDSAYPCPFVLILCLPRNLLIFIWSFGWTNHLEN